MTSKEMHLMNRNPPLSRQRLALALTALLPAAPVLAVDVPPDAGSTLQELQSRPAESAPAVSPSPLHGDAAEKSAGAPDNGLRVLVKSFRVEGSTVFPAAELESLPAAMIGSEHTLNDLNEAARLVTRYYRKHGYSVARAYLPAQSVQDGRITIQVLEGRLSRVDVKNDSRVNPEHIQRLFDAQVQPGKIMDKARVNRALLLAGDLPGVGRVQGALRPGRELGSTDLMVSVPDGRPYEADLSLDNTGNRYTGQYRLGGHVAVNNPLRSGDRLDVQATLSDESLAYGRVQWDVPVGPNGLRVGANLGYSRYVLGDKFAVLDAEGDSQTFGMTAAWPWVLDLDRQVRVGVALEQRRLNDVIRATATDTDKEIASAVLTLTGSRAKARWSAGWRLEATFGSLDIQTPAEQQRDRLSARTQGDYTKVALGANYQYAFTDKSSLSLSADAQFAGGNLDSSEKFLLGGIGGVRAYPAGEGLGDEGWQATVEYRYRLLPLLQGVVFYDTGAIEINHSPFAAGDNSRSLSGQGVGLHASPVPNLSVRMNIAWRGSELPVSDTDQEPRVWLQAGYRF